MMATHPVYQVPSFSIFKSPTSKEKVETLIHCFMERRTLDTFFPPATIRANDGWVYTCVYDSRLSLSPDSVEVIISFQNHTYGRFAIIREAKKDCVNKEAQRKLI